MNHSQLQGIKENQTYFYMYIYLNANFTYLHIRK